MSKPRVGLVTIYHVPNYGSVLQAYATQVILERLGFECSIINYKYPNKWHRKNWGVGRCSIKSKIATFLTLTKYHKKVHRLNIFRKKYFNFTQKYDSLDALREYDWSSFSAVIVGSDQVWNHRFTHADSVFMLSFVPDFVPKISIASSFATTKLPGEFIPKYKNYLSRFMSLSVRESDGKKVINGQLKIDKEVEVLLDPTLLLSKNDWLNIFKYKLEPPKCKYILLYMLTYAFEPRPYIYKVIKYFKEKYGYDVILLEGTVDKNTANELNIQYKNDAEVSEFINLFTNASLVVTSSFHGTAFAANFGIPLISIVPDNDKDNRQKSLLNLLGLQQCIVSIDSKITEIHPDYNNESAAANLALLRNRSVEWIQNNLSLK